MEALRVGHRRISISRCFGAARKIAVNPSSKCHFVTLTSISTADEHCRTPNESINKRLRGLDSDIEHNPSLAILSTPLRRCKISQKILPRDLLLQFKSVYLPPSSQPSEISTEEEKDVKAKLKFIEGMDVDLPTLSRTTSVKPVLKEVILPGNLLRSAEKPGKSIYMTLNRSILDELMTTGKIEQFKGISSTTKIPSRLVEIVDWQIRFRVLQEAEVLLDQTDHVSPSDPKTAAEAEVSFLCLSTEAYHTLIAQGVPRRLLYHLEQLFPEESQRHHLVSMLQQMPQITQCTTQASTSTKLTVPADSIIAVPYLPPFGPVNVALWRARCFFGHPEAGQEELDHD
ncbi:unnamed protein product [Sympodiomycopsis kandeliae]